MQTTRISSSFDTDGFVAEGTGDNFFIIKGDTIISPEGRNILRGISRDYVMDELAPQLGMKAIEKNFEAYDVYTADEAFMTGTPFCMLPVTQLNGLNIGDGKVGPKFKHILNKWSDNVGVNIEGQIMNWNSVDLPNKSGAPTPYSFKK